MGAVGGRRRGGHLEGPRLTAADLKPEGERYLLTIRGEIRKRTGGSHGPRHGVEREVPATESLSRLLRWLLRTHPNPLGPEHPLIWDAEDPTKSASYDDLRTELDEAWLEEFEEPRPKEVLFHSIIRTLITTLIDNSASVAEVAAFTGRGVPVILQRYYRPRPETTRRTGNMLGELRKGKASKLPGGPGDSHGPARGPKNGSEESAD